MDTKHSPGWIRLLLLLLITAVSLNWFTFNKGWQYYLQLNATRVDPFGLSFYPTTPIPPTPHVTRVVFFGDSRAELWPAPSLAGYEFLNRGISAQTSAQVVGRFAAHVAPLQPDVVVLQMCINDLKTIPLFPHRENQIIADCQANIGRLVDKTQELGAAIILTTLFPTAQPSFERKLFWSDGVDSAVLQVNDYIRTLETDNVFVLDAYHLLVGSDGYIVPSYAADFLHLKKVGYAPLNETLIQWLPEITLSGIQSPCNGSSCFNPQ